MTNEKKNLMSIRVVPGSRPSGSGGSGGRPRVGWWRQLGAVAEVERVGGGGAAVKCHNEGDWWGGRRLTEGWWPGADWPQSG